MTTARAHRPLPILPPDYETQELKDPTVVDHARAMAGKLDKNGYMTFSGITNENVSMGFSQREARGIAMNVEVLGAPIAGLCPGYVKPEDATKYQHSDSHKIYIPGTGKVDRPKLDAVDEYMTWVIYDRKTGVLTPADEKTPNAERILYKYKHDQALDKTRKEYQATTSIFGRHASGNEQDGFWGQAATTDSTGKLFTLRGIFRMQYLNPDVWKKTIQEFAKTKEPEPSLFNRLMRVF